MGVPKLPVVTGRHNPTPPKADKPENSSRRVNYFSANNSQALNTPRNRGDVAATTSRGSATRLPSINEHKNNNSAHQKEDYFDRNAKLRRLMAEAEMSDTDAD